MHEFMSEPIRQKAYQAFGDLLTGFSGNRGNKCYRLPPRSEPGDGTASVGICSRKGVQYRREMFASYPANVIVIRLTADQAGQPLSFRRL